MNYPRIYKAKEEIVAHFNSSIRQVFTVTELEELLDAHRERWRPAKAMSGYEFASFLREVGSLTPFSIELPSRTFTRYVWNWDEVTPFEIAGSLTPHGYLCHRSAIELHGLATKQSTEFYVNEEQKSGSQSSGQLSQEGIDKAFRKGPRITNSIAQVDHHAFCHLTGKNTGHLGVISLPITDRKLSTLSSALMTAEQGQAKDNTTLLTLQLSVTDIERTLIDAAVRPIYAGGVADVLHAYRLAADRLSIPRLAVMLRDIAHIYPYHQSVGFYLERSGVYSKGDLEELHSIETQYDFYLDYAIEDPIYCKRWRIYYPASLEKDKR